MEINESRKQKQWIKLSDYMTKQEQVFYSHPEEERIKHIGISQLGSNFYYNLPVTPRWQAKCHGH
ncbi:MAG: hypothetical protein IJZ86_08340 [Bacteroides sp.]|nr:hypothetical protein [Bacteroides sp.]